MAEQNSETGKRSAVKRLVSWFLRPKTAVLWHPESPGEKVTVTRTWIGRLCKPIAFATLTETMKDGIEWVDMTCPVCGYYCVGKGGHGCIDKPSFMGR